jgi:hypothetical protein
MAVIIAIFAPGNIQQASSTGLTPGLAAGTATFGGGVGNTKTSGFACGTISPIAESISSAAITAQKNEEFGGQLWEKILVIPRAKNLNFILSAQNFTVEAWSTFKQTLHTLTSIIITGTGGLTLSGYTPPQVFGPQQSLIFTANVPQDGTPFVANVATFVFPGVGGADITVSGSRLVPFSFEIDWSGGFDEGMAWDTNILRAFSDLEQRVQLRSLPRYSAAFNVVTMDSRESGYLDTLLFDWQPRIFGVPWWMDATQTTAQANSGSSTISLDTTLKPAYVVGGLVMLWSDPFTWEVQSISAVGSSSVTTTAPLNSTWPSGTIIVPLRRGRLMDSVEVDKPAGFASSFVVNFACEVV